MDILKSIYNYIVLNKEWILSGIVVFFITSIVTLLKVMASKNRKNIRSNIDIVVGDANIHIGDKSDIQVIKEIKAAKEIEVKDIKITNKSSGRKKLHR